MEKRIFQVYQNIVDNAPLIHNITNYVTVNACANVELAFGGSPIMADDIDEVAEITSLSSALVINMGTLNKRTIESMLLAAKTANENNVPIIFDPVGCGFTKLRREFAKKLISEYQMAVVRGNISEVSFLIDQKQAATGKGVDVSEEDATAGINHTIDQAKTLASQLKCVVIITGADDVITDGKEVAIIHNGDAQMAKVTGTGCMLSSMLGVSVGANHDDPLAASIYAVAAMGLAGQKGAQAIKQTGSGNATLANLIIDNVSNTNAKLILAEADYEVK